jgi:hypothetical protein
MSQHKKTRGSFKIDFEKNGKLGCFVWLST